MAELGSTTPKPQEAEVLLLGPGYGEAVAIHAEGVWITIDSCTDPITKQSATLAYLSRIGIPLTSVALVVATHWHDDHIRGLANLYKACTGAELVISGALKQREFLELVETYSVWPPEATTITSGVDEIRDTLREARRRGPAPRFAHQDQLIWRSSSGNSELWSLSPSNDMLLLAFKEIAAALPKRHRPKNRVNPRATNHIAVAMLFRSGNQVVLLGSDLENTPNPRTGWAAVVASTTRPPNRASIFKVAHHGSVTGEHAGIWSTLLDHRPISVLTPFVRGAIYLPQPADIDRIKRSSSLSAITSEPRVRTFPRRGALAKLTKPKRLRRIDIGFGSLRCRADMHGAPGSWNLEYGGDARKL